MEICHPPCIEILTDFLADLKEHAGYRSIDCAGGDGRLSESFLQKHYSKVDLFDGCPLAVEKAKATLSHLSCFGYAEQAYMQDFRWRFYYSAIYMVWCVGYLERAQLVAFLKTAKSRLMAQPGRMSRSSTPDSFIFVLDNVLSYGEKSVVIKRQRVRSQSELEAIFHEAGLVVYKRSGRKTMPDPFRDVHVWALY